MHLAINTVRIVKAILITNVIESQSQVKLSQVKMIVSWIYSCISDKRGVFYYTIFVNDVNYLYDKESKNSNSSYYSKKGS